MSSTDVIVFDFDGVLAEGMWPKPELGAPIQEGVDLLVEYFQAGWAIVIHTARPAGHEPAIRQWLRDYGLGKFIYDVRCGKPLADLYVDDKAFRPAFCDPALPSSQVPVDPDEDDAEEAFTAYEVMG